ncbi:50S ribosomal protein L10 [uncultured Algimonas sp.]|uniref:50S ribosomal protein L10 n=1 Tax=uncultured Algimonas sp. TaxID=1547920 RepID=UPI00262A05EA|nr:50S ribosomal protein L10 [uncultured Algimonas sp.]
MDRTQKAEAVEELKSIFAEAGSVVMAEYSGMTVAEMTDLRAKLRERGATIRVVKNRLAKIAMKDQPFEGAGAMFKGPVAIAWADDMISAPKVAVEFQKESDAFKIIGGFMGDEVFDSSGIDSLSKLPSREELISMAAQRLLSQATNVASALMSPARSLSGAIATIEEKADA